MNHPDVVLERCGVGATHRRRGIGAALTEARLVAAIHVGAPSCAIADVP